ncbi:hypothetical protein FRC09_001331 [Ceratobasidium sp. 395]|nr:hypothetical protein FRC09_001331 [Ceratobasidium sp. 395]
MFSLVNPREKAEDPAFVFEPPPGGDVSLRSVDGSVFCVHSIILGLVSPVFSDMFSLGRSSGEAIDLSDDSESVSLLLAFVYPSSVTPTINKLGTLEKCLLIAQKYNVEKIIQTLDRDLSLSEAKTGLIRRSNPLQAFRIAVTYGLRECQTLAAQAIMPRHISLLNPKEIVNFAQEYPTAAHAIGLVSTQLLRAKILSEVLFCFHSEFLPRTSMIVDPGQTSDFLNEGGGELLMCDGCISRTNDFWTCQDRPIEYVPSWIHGWSRVAYEELVDRPLDECPHLFDVSFMSSLTEDCMDVCEDCIHAATNAKSYYAGRPGEVFEDWASGVRALLRRELTQLDCLYSL